MPSLAKLFAHNPTQHATNIEAIKNFAPNLLRTSKRRDLEEAVAKYITQDPASLDMLAQARILAFRKDPVLINGPTGTGKELVANILNSQCYTPSNDPAFPGLHIPITPINCAGLTETLFESLIHGHKRGSYTGAVSDEPGLLRSASSGSAFFDEVGELPLSQQAKLLRVLQTSRVRPVGDTAEYPISCRFIFATHRDLKQMVKDGTFRADLYYRISRFVLHTSPLSSRPCDIPLIVKSIYEQEGWSLADPVPPPPQAYSEGNVRQLQNYLFRVEVLLLSPEEALFDL